MSSTRLLRSGKVEALVDASPDQVYAVLSDVTRIAEWSHECRGASWVGDASGPAVGARFRGRNRAALIAWSRVCTIIELDPGRRFAYVTDGGLARDATRWIVDVEATEGGTRIRQSFEVLSLPRPVELFVVAFIPAHADRLDALRADLLRLGEVAAGRLATSGGPA